MIGAELIDSSTGWLCVGSIAMVATSCVVTFLVLADRRERRAVREWLRELLERDKS